MMMGKRTIVSALKPFRFEGEYSVHLMVWFEEIGGPHRFIASPLDVEAHGRELWIRAMAGEYGPVEILSPTVQVELGNDR